MNPSWCYLFEAKGIQRYILDSGRLKDLIGASDLIASLSRSNENDLISGVLAAAKIGDVKFSRRSGGSFCMHADNREDLDRFRALWRLAVGLVAPGMPYTDCDPVQASDFNKARDKAYSSQSGVRKNTAAFLLPAGGPLTRFNPRTGRVAVEEEDRGGALILLDVVTKAQVDRERSLTRALKTSGQEDTLAQAFLPKDDTNKNYRFPRHFETRDASRTNPAFPLGVSSKAQNWTADRRVAIVHADISGLGQIYREIADQATSEDALFEVATRIEECIAAAVRQACIDTVLPFSAIAGDKGFETLFGPNTRTSPDVCIPPARPVVLGGDDITVIVRADLAMPFTKALLENIETETFRVFGEMGWQNVPRAGLTACAGVAIVSSGHPFLAAHNMAEGMCRFAKKYAKAAGKAPYPSLITFSVITSTIDEAFETEYREREHKTFDGRFLSAGPYGVGDHAAGHCGYNDLLRLAKTLNAIPGLGKLYEALSNRYDGTHTALRTWKRFLAVAAETEAAEDDLRSGFSGLGLNTLQENDWPQMDEALPYISDALELIDIGVVQEQRRLTE
ncbi:hypothetical protein [uncultured Aliiroseovarius sp.]|uniref:hypothetical protein n=1 Tax=uncultured Aliiroseovarius sp. TaxID=1658783 RepID=UPI00262B4FA8|nr:hypothetical protein [uncultured Aliiroseovarius sp.]